jgi:tetraacyldisaccharide 4'-kinase
LGSALRFRFTTPHKLAVPVICIGNLVMGGSGKTPTAIAIATYLKTKGHSPHILSRGYGAHVPTPILVDPSRHQAKDVGDEPLLLAIAAPTWVCKDRVASGQAAIAAGADVLILDDGLQNPTLHKDLALVVVNGQQGFGNGRVFPAGPLREPIETGMARADGIILIDKDEHNLGQFFTQPVLKSSFQCTNSSPKKVFAFTGLGYPPKFYKTLESLGYEIAGSQSFPDHHPYQTNEIHELIACAKKMKAHLVTTEKDILRIPLELRMGIEVIKIELKFESTDQLDQLLQKINL